jgi:hypothetical protein
MHLGVIWGELAVWILLAWTAIGALGVTLSFLQGQRSRAWHNLRWIAIVWAVYLAVLLSVSFAARKRSPAAAAQPTRCFDDLCFTVLRTSEVRGYLARNGERDLLVSIQVSNRSPHKPQRDPAIRSWLIDGQGRHWQQVRGLQGVRLTAVVPAGGSILSEPVFKVARDATSFHLVLTHGTRIPDALVIGSPDSLMHPPAELPLPQ